MQQVELRIESSDSVARSLEDGHVAVAVQDQSKNLPRICRAAFSRHVTPSSCRKFVVRLLGRLCADVCSSVVATVPEIPVRMKPSQVSFVVALFSPSLSPSVSTVCSH